jgi:O-antigen/teichoic acid export membrane protein
VRVRSGEGALYSVAGRALGWSFASTAIGRLSTMTIGIAIARILGPGEFGAYAVAMVAMLAVLSFNELGVSLAIVRWPGDPREIAPTVATLSIVSSLLVYAACFFGAPVFAASMGEPDATSVIRVLTFCVVIDGLVAAPVAVMLREFRQARKMVADQAATWVGAITSISCALGGLGAMSLAIGQLAGATVGALLFMCFEPSAMRLSFERAKAAALLKFGLPLAGSSIVVFAVGNVDRLIVGAVLGPVPLGVYVLAVNLANWPISVFSQPVRAVAPATLARLQGDPPAMRWTFLSTAGLLAGVTLPVCALLGGTAEPLIRFVYGSVWSGAASVLPWLAALAALRILFELCYDFFVVLTKTRVVLTAQVVWLAALVPLTVLGARLAGAPGAAAAQFVVALLLVLPIYTYELHRARVPLRGLASRLVLPAALASLVALAAWLITRVVAVDLVALGVSGLIGTGAIGLLLYRMRAVLMEMRGMSAGQLAGSGGTPAAALSAGTV